MNMNIKPDREYMENRPRNLAVSRILPTLGVGLNTPKGAPQEKRFDGARGGDGDLSGTILRFIRDSAG